MRAMDRAQSRDRGEEAERAAARGEEELAIGGRHLRRLVAAHVGHDEDARLRRRSRKATARGRARRGRRDARRRSAPRRHPSRRSGSPLPSVSVAEVTSTPWAGLATSSAKGRVGSIQWRCSPTSSSWPSMRSMREPVDESARAAPERSRAACALPAAELDDAAALEAAHRRLDAEARRPGRARRPRRRADASAARREAAAAHRDRLERQRQRARRRRRAPSIGGRSSVSRL